MKDRIWKMPSEKTADDLREDYIEGNQRRNNLIEAMPPGWYLDKISGKAYECGRITGRLEAQFEELSRIMGVEAAQRVHADARREMEFPYIPEIRNGKWSDISGQACLCSVCGRPQNYKQAMGWKYCPCCGAKMQEVEKNE